MVMRRPLWRAPTAVRIPRRLFLFFPLARCGIHPPPTVWRSAALSFSKLNNSFHFFEDVANPQYMFRRMLLAVVIIGNVTLLLGRCAVESGFVLIGQGSLTMILTVCRET